MCGLEVCSYSIATAARSSDRGCGLVMTACAAWVADWGGNTQIYWYWGNSVPSAFLGMSSSYRLNSFEKTCKF